jgi:ribosome maturation factor RimP
VSLQTKLDKITELADGIVSALGMIVLEVKFSQHGQRRTIEVTLHRPHGQVALEDCEQVSRELEKQLDEMEPPLIDNAYMLEVQSPGLCRVLKTERDFQVFSGEMLEIKSRQKVDGLGDYFKGKLVSFGDGRLTIGNPEPIVVNTKSKSKHKPKAGAETLETSMPAQVELAQSELLQARLYAAELFK